MTIAKKLLKAAMWLALAGTGLLMAIYLVVLGINWHDQPPSQAALRLMAISADRPPVADQDNAYVYLMGFLAEPGQDPCAQGMQRIAWFQAQLAKSPGASPDMRGAPGKDFDFKAQRPADIKALSEACKETDVRCLKALETGDETIAAWLASESWLLARYRTLLAHSGYRDSLPFDFQAPIPPYSGVHEGQKLLLARAWQLAGQGDAAGVKKLLAEDIGFWRQRLASADTLLTKMMATRALQRHFTGANLALRRLPPAVMAQGVPPAWITPLSDAERAMLHALAGEWTASASAFRQAKEKASLALYTTESVPIAERLLGPLFKPMLQVQATSNRQADQLVADEAMLQVPYAQYPAAVERVRAQWDKDAEGQPFKHLYNPIGEILLAIGNWETGAYGARVCDLEGLRRIALLTTELRSQGVATAQLTHKLAEATARNPYTGQPFVWDDTAKALVFTGLAQGERGRHALVY